MSRVHASRIISMVIVVSLFAPSLMSGHSSATGASNDEATITDNVCILIQGETEMVPGVQSDHDFFALRIVDYVLPYDVNRIFTVVPSGARNVSVISPSGANYGWISSGPMAGKFFIDVPSGYSREGAPFNYTGFAGEFLGGSLVNTVYSSSSLHLSPNHTWGNATSVVIPIPNCHNITSANMSAYGTNMTSVSGELSNDGGLHWVPAVGTNEVQFVSTGSDLKVRLTLQGNTSQGGDPKVTGFRVSARYVALTVPLLAHISYLWTPTFIDGKTTLDVTEPLTYAENGTLALMVYLVKGYNVSAQGVDLKRDTTNAVSAYPEKDLYINMSLVGGASPSFTIEVLAPPQTPLPWPLYLISAVLGVFILGAFVAVRRQGLGRSRRTSRASATNSPTSLADSAPEEDNSMRRDELIKRKKEVLSRVEEVNEKRSSGTIGKAEADAELSAMKRELKGMRNELNKVSRRSKVAEPESVPAVAISGEYESVLASLARIDDDFEHGRLPEAAYKSVREEYLSKAAKLMAERKAAEALAMSPLEAEKLKLMEAIVSLDAALEKGEIEAKVYEDLSASYKKELAGIMRRMDDSRGG